MTAMEPLFEAYRQALGDAPGASASQRAGVLRASEAAASRRQTARWGAGLGLGLAVAAAVLLVTRLAWPAGEPLALEVDGRPVSEGAWVGTAAPQELHFSDESKLSLPADSRLRIDTLGASEVQLTLEAGRVSAHVEPGGPRRWSLRAGPYEVRVLGTDFDVDWDGTDGAVLVRVRHGVVRVGRLDRGPEGTRVEVRAGQTLRMDREGHQLVNAEAPERAGAPVEFHDAEQIDEGDTEQPPADAHEPAAAGSTASEPRSAPRRVSRVPAEDQRWKALAADGRFRESLAAARATGIASLRQTLPAADLLALADAARLAGDRPEARRTLEVLKDRFPQSRESSAATFRLGRIAADAGDYRKALTHFDAYVATSPRGRHVAQAEGRALEAASRLGRPTGERARRYLARHPEGPYSRLAARLAGPPH